jgi:hypothetical protein
VVRSVVQQQLHEALAREVARLPTDITQAPNAWAVSVAPGDERTAEVLRQWEHRLATAALDALERRGLFVAGPVSVRVVVDPALAPDEVLVTGQRAKAAAQPLAADGRIRLSSAQGGEVRWGSAASTGAEQVVVIRRGRSTLGRARTCDIQLDDPSVRDRHLELDVDEGGGVHVQALDPHGLLMVDGRPVRAAELADGSRLQVGHVELIVRGPAAPVEGAGSGVVGQGPFYRGLRDTPARLWVVTALIVLGAVGLGLAVALLRSSVPLAAVVGGVGGLVGTTGLVLAVRRNLFEDVS